MGIQLHYPLDVDKCVLGMLLWAMASYATRQQQDIQMGVMITLQ